MAGRLAAGPPVRLNDMVDEYVRRLLITLWALANLGVVIMLVGDVADGDWGRVFGECYLLAFTNAVTLAVSLLFSPADG